MNKGNNNDFDMKTLFEKQKAASANQQFGRKNNTETKKEIGKPAAKSGQNNRDLNESKNTNDNSPMEIDKETEAKILEMVNSFVNLANQHAESRTLPINLISDAFLYAAARYNAFLIASADHKRMGIEQTEFVDAFVEQYKAMLKDHFEFYKNNPL
ncbi:MAG: DUF3144 domain-containing protein [Endozoicomonadaceae bacterium]|nr:DUF3144 domain-containing protein [Endozoicomonadaceae bacterium]